MLSTICDCSSYSNMIIQNSLDRPTLTKYKKKTKMLKQTLNLNQAIVSTFEQTKCKTESTIKLAHQYFRPDKMFVTSLRSFLSRTSIHGLGYAVDAKGGKCVRLAWVVCVALSVLAALKVRDTFYVFLYCIFCGIFLCRWFRSTFKTGPSSRLWSPP